MAAWTVWSHRFGGTCVHQKVRELLRGRALGTGVCILGSRTRVGSGEPSCRSATLRGGLEQVPAPTAQATSPCECWKPAGGRPAPGRGDAGTRGRGDAERAPPGSPRPTRGFPRRPGGAGRGSRRCCGGPSRAGRRHRGSAAEGPEPSSAASRNRQLNGAAAAVPGRGSAVLRLPAAVGKGGARRGLGAGRRAGAPCPPFPSPRAARPGPSPSRLFPVTLSRQLPASSCTATPPHPGRSAVPPLPVPIPSVAMESPTALTLGLALVNLTSEFCCLPFLTLLNLFSLERENIPVHSV
jgi:hypothetical protein